ncbi:MAG: hypothetical protein ORN85_04000, partial [Sediminibacterium sp.]|nr:hypothetical protein [Sediminibacterium sp.]
VMEKLYNLIRVTLINLINIEKKFLIGIVVLLFFIGCDKNNDNGYDFYPTIYYDGTEIDKTIIICPPDTNSYVFTTINGDSFKWESRQYFPDTASYKVVGLEQKLKLDFFHYAASYLRVTITRGNVKKTSPEIFINGYAFAPPTVSISFKSDRWQPIDENTYQVCNNDTVTLTLNNPYNTNVKWYKDGNLLNGETKNTLKITSNGVYSSSGCTKSCPNFCFPTVYLSGVPPIEFEFGNFSFCN